MFGRGRRTVCLCSRTANSSLQVKDERNRRLLHQRKGVRSGYCAWQSDFVRPKHRFPRFFRFAFRFQALGVLQCFRDCRVLLGVFYPLVRSSAACGTCLSFNTIRSFSEKAAKPRRVPRSDWNFTHLEGDRVNHRVEVPEGREDHDEHGVHIPRGTFSWLEM